ncbi:uncharacterized protein LOC118565138 [Fundulus heteroclitus]|uniref:uncharacterized protein LOC118565138 n=1 Tax=Fundulus heteroclitus TaxID=8078 RepID=UPI00165C4404|nr:uncharacterized protein LOC118565138 [Fundulus heteroclitus]
MMVVFVVMMMVMVVFVIMVVFVVMVMIIMRVTKKFVQKLVIVMVVFVIMVVFVVMMMVVFEVMMMVMVVFVIMVVFVVMGMIIMRVTKKFVQKMVMVSMMWVTMMMIIVVMRMMMMMRVIQVFKALIYMLMQILDLLLQGNFEAFGVQGFNVVDGTLLQPLQLGTGLSCQLLGVVVDVSFQVEQKMLQVLLQKEKQHQSRESDLSAYKNPKIHPASMSRYCPGGECLISRT